MATKTSTPVKSIETAIKIIEFLDAKGEAGVTEIANDVGVAKSTVHDHLKTLQAHEFLAKNGRKYRIGLRFLDHGGRARSRQKLYRVGHPEVRQLAERTGEVANLAVEEHGLGVYIDVARGENAINLDTYVGKREHLHSTAIGKAILAHLPEERVDEIIERHGLPRETDHTIDSREELEDELEEIQRRGFATDREERLHSLRCIAVPIMKGQSQVIGAISVSGPSSRMDDTRLEEELADQVTRTANIVEINVTYL